MDEWSPRGPVVFVDGRQQRDTSVRLPWDDPGLAAGFGAVETLAVVDGFPVFLDRHLARLVQSCTLLGLPAPDPGAMHFQVSIALAAWGAPEGVLRIQLTAGGHSILGVRPASELREKVSARFVEWPAAPFPPPRAKHTSRGGAVMAPTHHGVDEIIRVDRDGSVLEGTWSNVFCVVDNTLHTCPDDGRILPGVTRAVVLELAQRRGLDTVETAPLQHTPGAGWFITSSLNGVVPIHELDGQPLAPMSPVVRALQADLLHTTGRTPLPT